MNKNDLRFVLGMSVLLTLIAGCILWLHVAVTLAAVLLLAGIVGIGECGWELWKRKRDDHETVMRRLYAESHRCPHCAALSWDGFECYSCHHEETVALERAFERR